MIEIESDCVREVDPFPHYRDTLGVPVTIIEGWLI
tara:strand:+ start:250 stop:354 length:105 start_codon:yes stop_codon:yes gene_type:complete